MSWRDLEGICYRYGTDNKSAVNEQGLIGDIGGQWHLSLSLYSIYICYIYRIRRRLGAHKLQVPKTAAEEKESAEKKRAAIVARVAAAKAEQEKDPASAALILSRPSKKCSKTMQELKLRLTMLHIRRFGKSPVLEYLPDFFRGTESSSISRRKEEGDWRERSNFALWGASGHYMFLGPRPAKSV